MSESFVDLSYRGLALGRRIKLTQVRGATGYLEMPTPMPVGTTIAIATDEGVQIEALVAEVHEQTGGSDRTPGMVVRPALDASSAASDWWSARATPDAVPAAPVEDSRTMVMQAMVVSESGPVETEIVDLRDTNPTLAAVRDTSPGMHAVEDDGKRTMAMDAVDLQALGLTSASGELPAVAADEPPADDGTAKAKKKKKKR